MQGYKCLEDESDYLFERLRNFKHSEDCFIEWDRLEKEIEQIKEYCTYERMKEFYKNLFAVSN